MNNNVILFSYDTRINSITFWAVLGIELLIFILYIGIWRFNINRKKILSFALAEYVVALLLLTVVLRETPKYPDGFQNSLLCDKSFLSGNLDIEHTANIVLFLPMGMLLCGLLRNHRLLYTMLIGLFVSFIIEIAQYVLNKGVADVEDFICNGIGLFMGAIFCIIIKFINNK